MGGSGGGGGGAGDISYPNFMEQYLDNILWLGGAAPLTYTMNDALTDTIANNPFTGAAAFDPLARLQNMNLDIDAFATSIANWDEDTLGNYAVKSAAIIDSILSWPTMEAIDNITANIDPDDIDAFLKASGFIQSNLGSTVAIDADTDAFGNKLDEQITGTVLPRFEAGMRDINAVLSSAFVIGRAIIEANRDLEVAKHSSGLRVALQTQKDSMLGQAYLQEDKLRGMEHTQKVQTIAQAYLQYDALNINMRDKYTAYVMAGANAITGMIGSRYAWEESVARTRIDISRMEIVALKEQTDQDLEIDQLDAKWSISSFQYAANMLASIGGGVASPELKTKNTAASVLGGGLSGAAAGYQVGAGLAAAASTSTTTAAGGAASGAASGAAAGSSYPVIGTIIGAIVGAAAGYLSSQ